MAIARWTYTGEPTGDDPGHGNVQFNLSGTTATWAVSKVDADGLAHALAAALQNGKSFTVQLAPGGPVDTTVVVQGDDTDNNSWVLFTGKRQGAPGGLTPPVVGQSYFFDYGTTGRPIIDATEPVAEAPEWCLVQDVSDLVGAPATEDEERTHRLIQRATAIVASYICWPLVAMPIEEVPGPIREAVATMTARALTGAATPGGAVASEQMGGYSYRMAAPASAIDAMRISPDLAQLLSGYRCGGGSASVVVCSQCGCYGGGCTCRGFPPPGSSYAYCGPVAGSYWDYLMTPRNEVGSPFNSGRPGRWWRERERNTWHDGVETVA